MSASWVVVLVVGLAIIVLGVVPYLLATAHRLDRLHVRTDAAWAGLDAALARRAVVARTIAAGHTDAELRLAADHAENAPRPDRETAENELTKRLAELPRGSLAPALATELADAEHRVVLARRVHNDAVRDTKALRNMRAVRWLRLSGTAPWPRYFEIAEPELTAETGSAGGRPEHGPVRRAARVLLVDGNGRLLLFRGTDPGRRGVRWWFTPGGGVEVGEQLREAAVREVGEETGMALSAAELVGPVWRRQADFEFDARRVATDEWFFLAPCGLAGVDTGGFTDLERSTVDTHRWWCVDELATTTETVFPTHLATLLPPLLADGWDGQLRRIE